MKTTAYRVREVLRGHSSAAAVIAVDSDGREVRLEVGALEGASISVNEVLVLSWATVQVPRAVTPSASSASPEEEPLLGRSMADVESPTAVKDDASDDDASRAVDNEIRALMGLQ